ncbi:hypothetical protein C8R43DRAFT_1233315 [Mycena crocata]|nr:hypothetical protein C8R43DRAFT_1233315 [Mycena crocata]
MHRALKILEIMEAVCCEVPGGRALAALASTCKTFQDPALDVLWRTQDSIIPLLGCMPDDLFNERPNSFSMNYLELERAIVPTDWERTHAYITRVKHFEYEFNTPLSEIFASLEMSFPYGSLFPNLKSLSWQSDLEANFRFIRIFLTPKLAKLTFTYQPSIPNSSLLSTLAHTCPRLTALEIYVDYESGFHNTDVVSHFLRSLRQIESLTIPDIDAASLIHIAKLPTLTRLCLETVPPGPYPPSDARHSIFQNLKSLTTHGSEWEAHIEFFRMCPQLRLNFLYLCFDDFSSAANSRGLYMAIAASCSHTRLTHLYLNSMGGNPTEMAGDRAIDFAVNDALFRILFCFPNIKGLLVESPVDFDMGDTILAEAARTWAHIEDLRLTVFQRSPSWPFRVTLDTLSSFAQHCPHLRSLHLSLDATTLPIHPTSTTFMPQMHVIDLCIGQSPIAAPIGSIGAIARFISGLFPNLRKIGTPPYCKVPADVVERWQQVEALLPEFATARQEASVRAVS